MPWLKLLPENPTRNRRPVIAVIDRLKSIFAALAALCLASTGQTTNLSTPGENYCSTDQQICFVDVSSHLDLPDLSGERRPYSGRTWSISWGDANGNKWPDLYLNHHTYRSTKGRFPQSHLIYDLGLNPTDWAYTELPGRDQHSAIFVDVNGDGNIDIFELAGGNGGTGGLDTPNTKNSVFLGASNQFDAQEVAIGLGLAMSGARGRSAFPINQGGALRLFLLNAPRPDGLRKSTLMRKTQAGSFEIDKAVVNEACKRTGCRKVAAEIGDCRNATQLHLDQDDFVDILCFNTGDSNDLRFFSGSSDGTHFVARNRLTRFGKFRDGSVLDINNDGQFEFLSIANRRLQLITIRQTSGSTSGIQKERVGFFGVGKPGSLVTGDWDNDTDIDFLTYLDTGGGSFQFVIWQNDGLGHFKAYPFEDKKNLGFARNVAVADYDLDGALDILFSDGKAPQDRSMSGGYVLLKGISRKNWLEIDLRDNSGLRGLGARVTVETEETSMLRGQYSGVHAEVQDFDRLHFGLGGSGAVQVLVKWADGSQSRLENVAANQVLTISQNQP